MLEFVPSIAWKWCDLTDSRLSFERDNEAAAAALDTLGASFSPAPLHLPTSSTASSCTIGWAEVHLLRKRR